MKHYPEAYGKWSGNERGIKPDYSRCCVEVRSSDGWRSYQCKRARGHGEDGAYCKTHDPEAIKARQIERDKKNAERYRNDMLKIYGPSFYEALKAIADGHNDPRSLAREAIERFEK